MAKQTPTSHLNPPSVKLAEGWTPAQATQALLASRGCARPVGTVAGLLRKLLAVRASCGEPGPLRLDEFFWIMAFNDWVYFPPRPSDAEELIQAEAILTKALNGPKSLPALPSWPPEGTPTGIKNALWGHLDLLGLRTLALRQCLGAGASMDEFADPYVEFPLLVDLAGQFGQRRSWKRDDPDLQGILDRMAEVLETCHQALDRVEEAEGLRLPPDLSWLRPHYPVATPVATGSDACLSSSLQDDLRAALRERGSALGRQPELTRACSPKLDHPARHRRTSS